MAERITIIVEPSLEHGDILTVQDAMRQVLDFIEIVAAAASDDARQKIGWALLSATTNSPFTAVAEAFSVHSDLPVVDQPAREAKARVGEAFKIAANTGDLPDWLVGDAKGQFERIFRRNLNGVGRTSCRFDEATPPIVIVERIARQTLDKIQQAATRQLSLTPDRSGEELGSIDGHVLEAITHYGRPALRVLDRLSNEKVLCVISDEIAEDIGQRHDWRDVWSGERVRVTGRIKRNVAGQMSLITADNVIQIRPQARAINEVADPQITGGKGVREYLDELWDGPSGED